MDLERLEAALRAAHAAGDTGAAQRLAAALREARAAAGTGGADASSAQPRAELQQRYDEMVGRLGPAPSTPIPQPMPAAEVPTPRDLGRQSAQDRGGALAAAAQGLGSMTFGVGTPATAAGELVASHLDPRREGLRPSEAMEYARGRRAGLAEEHPVAYGAGMVGGIFSSGRVAGQALSKAPAAVRTVFTPQSKQTARNIARLAATGAAAAGTTAAMEQGAEAAPTAAAFGAIAGPVGAAAVGGGSAAFRSIHSRIDPNNAAIRLLARRLGEPVEELTRRYGEFVSSMGRAPRLVEIMRREAAEEMGQIGRARSGAAQVFRDAEEHAALQRPIELSELFRAGHTTSNVPAQQELAAETTQKLRSSVSTGRGSGREILAARNQAFDDLMGQIGRHRVPLSPTMVQQIQNPDVWTSLEPSLRRRVSRILAAAEEGGTTPALRVRDWDAIRTDLAGRAGPGSRHTYRRLRNRIRDYVGNAVPEYAEGLRRYGDLTDMARGMGAGKGVLPSALTRKTRDFADAVRLARGGGHERAGVAIRTRTTLYDALSGTPEQAEQFMSRLASDRGLQDNLRTALTDTEYTQLRGLIDQYGRRQRVSEGVQLGRRVFEQGGTEAFQHAVESASATPAGAAGVRAGARGALVDAAAESPVSAARTAVQVVENPGFVERLESALGRAETAQLRRVAGTASDAAKRLAAAAPSGSQAAGAAQEAAEDVQQVFRGIVVASGRWSGAFLANFINNLTQRVRLSPKAARRLAEMATDPVQADRVIARLRAARVEPEEIARMYREAAQAAGILVGRE